MKLKKDENLQNKCKAFSIFLVDHICHNSFDSRLYLLKYSIYGLC